MLLENKNAVIYFRGRVDDRALSNVYINFTLNNKSKQSSEDIIK